MLRAWLRSKARPERSQTPRSGQSCEVAFRAQALQMVRVGPVVGIVDEAPQMDDVTARKVCQEVIGADLVALGGRVGDAMREKQDLRQSAHPMPREISGPSAFARGRGRRRQSATQRAYLGLSGFTLGSSD